MEKINVSSKIKLNSGDEYILIEKKFLEEDGDRKTNIEINNNPSSKINIRKIRTPISIATILLTQQDDYVGHISATLYNNFTASLMMSGIRSIELPSELIQYADVIAAHDTALLVDEKYRRQGKASQLMKLMLQYLDKKGISDLEVCGIVDDIAMKTYLKTGAEVVGEKKAIYRNIKRFIQKEKKEISDEIDR